MDDETEKFSLQRHNIVYLNIVNMKHKCHLCNQWDIQLDRSEISDGLAAKWATILSLSNPLLDTLRVENMLFIAVKRCNEIVTKEVTPADGTLTPQARLALVQASTRLLLLLCGALVLKLGLV